jgi:hypothetical protein
MHRRNFIATIGAVGTVAATGGLPGQLAAATKTDAAASGPAGALLRGTPAVFAPTPISLTVSLPLKNATLAWIEYGETEALGLEARADAFGYVPHDDTVLKIRLEKLKPGTRYYWRAVLRPLEGGGETRTKIYTAKTISPGAPDTRFSVWNDTHDHADTIQALHAARDAGDDFLLWNGDLSNNVKTRDIIPGLYVSPRGVDLADGPAILLTRGNHDVRGLWANKVGDYVDFPGGQPFYAFRTGPIGVIALDTGEDKPDDHPSFRGTAAFEPLLKKQARWLEWAVTVPALRDAPYRMIVCHIPLRWTNEGPQDYNNKGFDRFSLRGRNLWHDSIVKWGAQVVVSAHCHRLTWLPANKQFPYCQLVGGGPDLEEATLIRCQANAQKMVLSAVMIHDNTLAREESFKPLVA